MNGMGNKNMKGNCLGGLYDTIEDIVTAFCYYKFITGPAISDCFSDGKTLLIGLLQDSWQET